MLKLALVCPLRLYPSEAHTRIQSFSRHTTSYPPRSSTALYTRRIGSGRLQNTGL